LSYKSHNTFSFGRYVLEIIVAWKFLRSLSCCCAQHRITEGILR